MIAIVAEKRPIPLKRQYERLSRRFEIEETNG